MGEPAITYRRQKEDVNAHFESRSFYWSEVYSRKTVYAQVFRDRQVAVLNLIDNLALAPDSHALEVGCGAGFLSIALAQRGLQIQAIDVAEAMVELTRQHTKEFGVSEQLRVEVGDAYALAFADNSFDLVVAVGVTAWLERPELAIQEFARVTRPGGHIILTHGNQKALHMLLDPAMNPLLRPLRKGVKDVLERIGILRAGSKPVMAAVDSNGFIDKLVARAGLVKVRGMTVGFGPFTFLYRKILPESLGIALHHRLQRLADQKVALLRATGMSYIVLATKPTSSDSNRLYKRD